MTNKLDVVTDKPASLLPSNSDNSPALVRKLDGLVDYEDVVARMEKIASGIAAGREPETVFMLEHPPLFTKGTSAQDQDLLDPLGFAVYETGRGGEFTYHGPGQRIVYLMLNLDRRERDVRLYVRTLESWIIAALAKLGVTGERREGRVGIWVQRPDKGAGVEDKIAAIGIRVRKWVTFHGISINVDPDLSHYNGIVPCGISDHGVTSLADLGVDADMAALDDALLATFPDHFGPFAE